MNKYFEELGGHSDIRLSCNKCGKKTDDLFLVTKNRKDYLLCEYHANKRREHDNSENKES